MMKAPSFFSSRSYAFSSHVRSFRARFEAMDEADARAVEAGTWTVRHWEAAWYAEKLRAGATVYVDRAVLVPFVSDLPASRRGDPERSPFDPDFYELAADGRVRSVELAPWGRRPLHFGTPHPRLDRIRTPPWKDAPDD